MNNINKLIELIFIINRLTKEGMEHEKGSPSYIQLQTLAFISRQKNPIMKDVAEYLNITPPSTTFLVNNLIKLSLVNRVYDNDDKRITHLVVSTKGKKKLQAGFVKSKKYLHKKLTLLSIKERQNFILILKKLSLLVNSK
jgi:DNA-binding MarR family transcriptional regulator